MWDVNIVVVKKLYAVLNYKQTCVLTSQLYFIKLVTFILILK